MTQSITKKAIQNTLDNPHCQCFCLFGPWGTGKTHLLNQEILKRKLDRIVISLFGIESADQLRKSVLSELSLHFAMDNKIVGKVRRSNKESNAQQSQGIFQHLTGRLFDSYGGILTDSTDFILKRITKPITIIFEDIERGSKIDLEAFLGIAETLKANSNIRVIFVVNKEELSESKQKTWNTFREKVIDKEIPLSISAQEAAFFGSKVLPELLKPDFMTAIDAVGLINIRAIDKVACDLLEISKYFQKPMAPDYQCLIHSTVVFSAIHWGMFKSVVEFEDLFRLHSNFYYKLESENVDEKDKKDGEFWESVLRKLNIIDLDDFETEILTNFFKTGYFDASRCQEYIEYFDKTNEERKYLSKIDKFYQKYFWDASTTKDTLKKEFSELISDCYLLDETNISKLLKFNDDFLGDSDSMRTEIIKKWKQKLQEHADKLDELVESWPRTIDPEIKTLLLNKKKIAPNLISLETALLKLHHEKTMSIETKKIIASAKKQELKNLLLNSTAEDLPKIIKTLNQYLYNSVTGHEFNKMLQEYCMAINELKDKKDRLSEILKHAYPKEISYPPNV